MQRKNSFRLIAIIPPLMIIAYFTLSVVDISLPPQAVMYQEWYATQPLSGLDEALIWAGITGYALLVVSTIGVMFFLKWARLLYSFSAALTIFSQYITVPIIMHSWGIIITDIAVFFIGATVTLSWAGVVHENFHTKPNYSLNHGRS
jgi:hypothetical protein